TITVALQFGDAELLFDERLRETRICFTLAGLHNLADQKANSLHFTILDVIGSFLILSQYLSYYLGYLAFITDLNKILLSRNCFRICTGLKELGKYILCSR